MGGWAVVQLFISNLKMSTNNKITDIMCELFKENS